VKKEGIDNYLDSSEELKKQGIYYVTGMLEQDSLLEIQQDILLKHLDKEWVEDVQLFINSVGGECSEGWALLDLLRFVRMDVHTRGMGECCSMGAMLLACGDYRVGCRNLSVMVHGASAYNFVDGNKQDITAKKKWVDQEHERDMRFWLEHSKYKTRKQIEKLFLDGLDKYMTVEQALKHGILDKVQE